MEYARVFRREKGEKRGEAIERSDAETPDQSSYLKNCTGTGGNRAVILTVDKNLVFSH